MGLSRGTTAFGSHRSKGRACFTHRRRDRDQVVVNETRHAPRDLVTTPVRVGHVQAPGGSRCRRHDPRDESGSARLWARACVQDLLRRLRRLTEQEDAPQGRREGVQNLTDRKSVV